MFVDMHIWHCMIYHSAVLFFLYVFLLDEMRMKSIAFKIRHCLQFLMSRALTRRFSNDRQVFCWGHSAGP
jgi:hypothetical protein